MAARALVIFFPALRLIGFPYLPPPWANFQGRGTRFTCRIQAVTSIPMLRAVPFTLLTAASIEAAFRSGIFCLAISKTCFSVTLPTLSLLGVPEPLAIPAARFRSTDAGGVLVIKV